MPLDHWQQVNEIYVEALVREPGQRQAYLLEVCGADTDLRRAVESRLALFSAEHADPPLARGIVGRTISHYEVGERVGAGGMGTVYRARDLRLGRMVALKFLKGELVASVDARQRFVREGHALSSLSHPNIATLYEVDEIEGLPFLVLEYLPGGTLRERIRGDMSKGIAPSLSQVAGWGIAVADALAHAHRRGVLHRDVKSGNVMFDAEGRIKLTDFGLAKMLQVPEHSAPGTVGTLTYMAPEQAEGKTTDARSDLYSLGVVLYEAATGQLPLRADSLPGLLQQILYTVPAAPSVIRSHLPAAFDELVMGLLAKNPAERCQGADEVSRRLHAIRDGAGSYADATTRTIGVKLPGGKQRRRWMLGSVAAALGLVIAGSTGRLRNWLTTSSTLSRKQVAVLALRSIGGDAQQQAFVDGLTETITTALTRQPELSVVSSNDARQLNTAAAARRDFGVNLVVSGSAHRRGDKLVLVIDFIDAKTLRQIEAQSIEWPVSELATLQDGVLSKVADFLSVAITQDQRTRLAASASPVASAHDAYLRGRGFLYRYDVGGNLERARDAFQDAIRRDPSFAAAYVGLSETLQHMYPTHRDAEVLRLARSAAERSVSLNPRLASAHTALGTVMILSKQPAEAEGEFETALRLDPLDPAVYRELAGLYQAERQFDQAEKVLRSAVNIRPGNWMSHNALADFYQSQQRYADSERAYRRVVELSPDNHLGYRNLGVALYRLGGHSAEAVKMSRKALELRPTARGYSNLGAMLMFLRQYREAVPVMEKAVEFARREAPNSFRIWGNLGDAYWLAKGESQKGRAAWLEAAAIAEKQLTGTPADAERLSLMANYLAKAGDKEGALRRIKSALDYGGDRAPVRYQAGLTYARLGQHEQAIEEIRLAIAYKYSKTEIQAAPELELLRMDPRFQQLFQSSSGR